MLEPLRHHRGARDRRLAGRHERAQGRGLGALSLGVGGVLDVGADIDPAARAAHGGADLELRVGRVRVGHDLGSRAQQRLGAVEQEVGVGARHQRAVLDSKLRTEIGELLARGGGVAGFGEDGLELDEAS